MKTDTTIGNKAKVNLNAIGTWLEPWIGWEVEFIKTSKNLIWFKWDIGHKFIIERYYKKCFNLFIKKINHE